MTSLQAQYEVPSLLDTLAPRLVGEKVIWWEYFEKDGSENWFRHSYDNPFIVVADSLDADLVATIRIGMMDYEKKKDLRSTADQIQRYHAMGMSRFWAAMKNSGFLVLTVRSQRQKLDP
jgi:hypothetical protein